MLNKIVRINEKEYVKVDLLELKQKGKSIYIGKISAPQMLEIYTVRPAKYDIEKNSSLARTFPSESDYYSHLVEQNKVTISDKDFQRKYSDSRVGEISKFLESEDYAFFPNTIIANCDLVNDLESFDPERFPDIASLSQFEYLPEQLSFFSKSEEKCEIFIPFTSDSLLIIDGQHRLEGLKKADNNKLGEYELLVAFILGYDRSVIAQQFYTINHEQKPVNKSLLYHLMGEFSTDLDELTFSHKIVKALNEVESSPFFQRIKMLGTAPSDMSSGQKQQLSISLAFLIDALIKTVSKSTSGLYQPIFRYYFLNESYQVEILKFLLNYFNAVKELIPDWTVPSNNLVSKGMGVGALIRIMQLLVPKMLVEDWGNDESKIKECTKDYLKEKLKGLENVDFSKEGPFGRSGSAGSLNKIKEDIVSNLEWIDEGDYNSFVEDYKSSEGILEEYKKWYSKKV